jgi:nitroreductase
MSKQYPTFETIRTRRVCRFFRDEPVSRDDLKHLIQAARWASSAGNRRIHKFVVVDDKKSVDLIRIISPGILGNPQALIVICTDEEKAELEGVNLDLDTTTWIDVGTASQNMMLAAHEMGIGTCPTTSFSKSAVRVLLNLPDYLEPEYILQVGHPEKQPKSIGRGAAAKLPIEEITFWGAFPRHVHMDSA